MKTLALTLSRSDFDSKGMVIIPDYYAGKIVSGYGTVKAYVMVDGSRKIGLVTFGHYCSFVTIKQYKR